MFDIPMMAVHLPVNAMVDDAMTTPCLCGAPAARFLGGHVHVQQQGRRLGS
jgi:hypothetical protein